jgi:hypothetical protein
MMLLLRIHSQKTRTVFRPKSGFVEETSSFDRLWPELVEELKMTFTKPRDGAQQSFKHPELVPSPSTLLGIKCFEGSKDDCCEPACGIKPDE